MAEPKGNQEYLGIDTNVLVAYLADDHPQHSDVKWLSKIVHVVNPTIIHEAYHTLVFKRKWPSSDTRRVLTDYIESSIFVSQTLRTTKLGLMLADKYGLGGRDALILASFIATIKPVINACVTFDEQLLGLESIRYGAKILRIIPPKPRASA
jgi:predicted nucleic acid-binding protein